MQALRLPACAAVIAAILATACACPEKRSRTERAAFVAAHPCPVANNGRNCPGHEVDHITPLCAGGADKSENMQWLTIDAHREKTRKDIAGCRR